MTRKIDGGEAEVGRFEVQRPRAAGFIRSLDRLDSDGASQTFDEEFIGLTLLASALLGEITFTQLGEYYRNRQECQLFGDLVHDVFDHAFQPPPKDADNEMVAIRAAHVRFATLFPRAYQMVRKFCQTEQTKE